MRDLAGPAQVSGHTDQGSREPLEFREKKTGKTARLDPDPSSNAFRAMLPEGEYEVAAGGVRRTMVLLPGGSYDMDFRTGRANRI